MQIPHVQREIELIRVYHDIFCFFSQNESCSEVDKTNPFHNFMLAKCHNNSPGQVLGLVGTNGIGKSTALMVGQPR